jgi:selenocysteine lyase/cysteine desulfurase
VKQLVEMAQAAGALTYIDAVQYAAHGPIDVQALGCDFLVASSYKFFGPHAGILYGKYDLLDKLFAYKVRPAPNELPGRFETGTQNHEGIAGVLGAVGMQPSIQVTNSARVTQKEQGNGSGASVGADDGANAMDARLAIQVRKFSLDQVSDLAGIFVAGGMGDKALARIAGSILGVLLHAADDFSDDPFLGANLLAGDQFPVLIHVHQRADVQQAADECRAAGYSPAAFVMG